MDQKRLIVSILWVTTWLVCSCAQPLEVAREPQTVDVANELYLTLCMRVAATDVAGDFDGSLARQVCAGEEAASEGQHQLAAMVAQKERLVAAFTTLLEDAPDEPAPFKEGLSDLLVDMLPLHDRGLVEAQTDASAALLRGIIDDPTMLAAAARLSSHRGHVPPDSVHAALADILASPGLGGLLSSVVGAVRDEGRGEQALADLMTSVSHATASGASTLDLSRDQTYRDLRALLLQRDPAFPDGVGRLVASRDDRGLAMPRLNDPTSPVVDRDDDGLADVDADGYFVAANGARLGLLPPFCALDDPADASRDELGRLLSADGQPAYAYADASETLVAATMVEARQMLRADPRLPIDLVGVLADALGPRTQLTHAYDDGSTQSFTGFDLEAGLAGDLIATAAALLHDSTVAALPLARRFLDDCETPVAGLVRLGWQLSDWLELEPWNDTELVEGSTLVNDLLDVAADIAREPGLLEGVLAGATHPETDLLGPLLAEYLRHVDGVDYDPLDLNGPPVGQLATPVNDGAPDAGLNVSVFQRFLALVNDAAGVRTCNKEGAKLVDFAGSDLLPEEANSFGECDLVEIEDMGAFYLQTIVGRGRMAIKEEAVKNQLDLVAEITGGEKSGLEYLSGIDGLTETPTVQAANRLIFAPRSVPMQALLDPPVGRDGLPLETRHPATVFALELDDNAFYRAIQPLLLPFVERGREDLFLRLLSVLHSHWPSPASDRTQSQDPSAPGYAAQTGVVRFGGLVANALDEGELLVSVRGLAIELTRAERNTVAAMVRDLVLPENNPDLSWPAPTPAHLARDLLVRATDFYDEHPELERLASVVSHRLLEVAGTTGTPRKLANRRAHAMARHVLAHVHAWADRYLAGHDVPALRAALVDDSHELLGHPLTASGLDFVASLATDEEAQRELVALFEYLGGGDEDRERLAGLAPMLVDVLGMVADDGPMSALLTVAARATRDEGGVWRPTVDVALGLLALDSEQVVARLARRLFRPAAEGSTFSVLQVFLEAVAEVNRDEPGAGGAFDQADVAAAGSTVIDFLENEQYGLGRLYQLAAGRAGGGS